MDEAERFAGELDVVVHHEIEHRAPPVKNIGWASAFGVLAGIALGAAGFPNLGAVTLGIGLILLRFLAKTNRTARTKNVTERMRVSVSSAGIEVEGRQTGRYTVSGRSIAKAYHQPRPDGSTVRCLDETGTVRFEAEVADAADARRFLRALGRDVAHDRLRYDLTAVTPSAFGRAVTAASAIVILVMALGLSSKGHGWAAAALCGVFVFAQVHLARKMWRSVEVGTDGLLLATSSGKRRFISYEDVREVVQNESVVDIVVKDGMRTRLELSPPRYGADGALEAMALCERIEDAREAHRGQNGTDEALARRLSKGDRPAGQWLKELAAIRTMEGGYRAAGTADGDLWRVVEDVGAPEEARAAAALMLRGTEEATPRLRVAAQATASPRLRVALETAADPTAEETELGEALAAFGERH